VSQRQLHGVESELPGLGAVESHPSASLRAGSFAKNAKTGPPSVS
jgi:hypothetical protein